MPEEVHPIILTFRLRTHGMRHTRMNR